MNEKEHLYFQVWKIITNGGKPEDHVISSKNTLKYFKKHHEDILIKMLSYYENIHCPKEFCHKYEYDHLNCHKCAVCGRMIPYGIYRSLENERKFTAFCSKACAKSEKAKELKVEKINNTYLKKYDHRLGGYRKGEKMHDYVAQKTFEKWGYENASSSPVIREKVKNTFEERWGGNIYKSPELSKNARATLERKFGKGWRGNAQIVEKTKKTCIEKYGADNPMGSDEVKQKLKNTNMQKYGMPSAMQNEQVFQKMMKTRRDHNGYTKLEKKVHDILLDYFDEDDIAREYKDDSRYPYHCDFYVKSTDIFIEVQGYWTHGKMPYDPNDELCKKEIMRLKSRIESGCKFSKRIYDVWSNDKTKDAEKRLCAKSNNLHYIEIFRFSEAHIRKLIEETLSIIQEKQNSSGPLF